MRKRMIALLLALVMAVPLFQSVPKVIRAESGISVPWDGETKTEPEEIEGVYQIGSAEELAWFAAYVNSLGDADTGVVEVDAVLLQDIDLGGQSWTPIGDTEYIVNAYAGTFDGQNHSVTGLKIDTTDTCFGLFRYVKGGTIQNLKVQGTVKSTQIVGGIIGRMNGGTVANCSMSGTVTTTGTSTKGYAGGIVGTIQAADGKLTGCCNTAAVQGSYAGGILGCNNLTGSPSIIRSCYNTGEITGITRSGGIAGQLQKGEMSYCYSIGQSTNGIAGFSNAEVMSCYYLADQTDDENTPPLGTAKDSYQVMPDRDKLLESLNADGSDLLFCADTWDINQGYPVLNWQLVSAVISVPVSSVAVLGEAKTGVILTAQAMGEADEAATNVVYQWAVSQDGKDFTDCDGETERNFLIPDTADYAGRYIRVTAVGEDESEAYEIIGPIAKSDTLILQENSEAVQKAKESLCLDQSVIKEATTIQLPKEWRGCVVSWTSSDPEIISQEGVVTLPEKNIVSVTLTAHITCGEAEADQLCTVDVWAAEVDPEVYLQKVVDSMKWDFKLLMPVFGEDTNILVKFRQVLERKGYEGITVTLQSTDDESLISKNGKITYPVIPGQGSFADGKQVQVVFHLTVGDTTVSYPSGNINALLVPWNTEDVRKILEQETDAALTETILCGDNRNLSSVVSDLTLPSCIEGDKYSFGQITWKSSDEAYLSISDENRQGSADAFDQPYVGKINQDQESHTVGLTATVKNPSTGVTVERVFEVTVLPMTEEQFGQTMETMKAILDCYTPDKLTDYTTKKVLDTETVTHDIQLVLPKDILTAEERISLNYGEYWDYWNYRFTVTSSDPEVIDVNGFRACVYRPLGEKASEDRPVTLQVKMESKTNPNFFVTKEIAVTVSHLDRAEINQALALMDRAKAGYAAGLLGANADTYSIIDNLTPYQEIVWNEDQSGVQYIYRYADRQNNGIVVDELPGWEEQEDWRLFHTSNKELLANETLLLEKTPAENTFVKVSSVLTDETFGKYYVKFQNSELYDAETLAKFKQLYKQPVSAYMMVVGAGNYTEAFVSMTPEQRAECCSKKLSEFKESLEAPISVSFTLLGMDGETIIARTEETSFTKGATVFDVFRKVLADHQIPYTAKGSYITSVNELSEYAYGDTSGWMYTVGGVFVNSYMNAQELSGGEDIVVKYVRDYTLGNFSAEPSPTPIPEIPTPVPSPATPAQSPADTSESVISEKPAATSVPAPDKRKKTVKQKKTIKKLTLIKCKRGSKKIAGKTIKKAKIVIQIRKKKYTATSGKKGKFVVKLKGKLRKKMKVKITVSKTGYRKRTKTLRIK